MKNFPKYEGKGILNPNFRINETVERIIWVLKRIEQKIDGEYASRPDKEVNRNWMLNHNEVFKLYYELKHKHETNEASDEENKTPVY